MRHLAQSIIPGEIFWRECDADEAARAATKGKTKEDVLALVPLREPMLKSTLVDKAMANGVGEKKSRGFIDQLCADGLLHVHKTPRPGTNPLIGLARYPQQLIKE